MILTSFYDMNQKKLTKKDYFIKLLLILVLHLQIYMIIVCIGMAPQTTVLRVRTVAKRHMRSSMFTASFILVS